MLDWIGLVVVLLLNGFLVTWPALIAPTYRAMFSEFATELPLFTRLALSLWLPLGFVALSVGLVTAAALLRTNLGIGNRRALAVLAFVVALAGVATCIVGVYLPIFQLAGAIE